ncbi:hypothetical protein ACEQ8H_006538 [Pleosporales sp. CAS-2024a]
MASPASAGSPSWAPRDGEVGEAGSHKKRKAGPNSRGVANLTPEQLARKRANDREAQRAIRERTKNQIDRLNQRIRELENQQPYHDLQLVLREKEAVQAENTDMRRRLADVVALIQPMLRASGGLNELAAAAARSPLTVLPTRDAPVQPRADARPWLYHADDARYASDQPDPPDQPDTPLDDRLAVDFLLDTHPRAVDPNLPPPQLPPPCNLSSDSHAQYAPSLVAHLTLPRNSQPTCPLDAILLTFLHDRHTRAAEGVPLTTLVGPRYPNFTALVYPDRPVESHPLSQLFTEILRTFPDICGKPEQVAIVFVMFLLMRWQIEPTPQNYDRLPHWITPRPAQLFVGHPCWFDHLPWPKLRDRLCAATPFVSFQNFFIPFTTTVSLNWPYEAKDVLLPASQVHTHTHTHTLSAAPGPAMAESPSPYSLNLHAASPQDPATPQQPQGPSAASILGLLRPHEDDQWLINPAFESHLRDLNNWSLGPSFRDTFPQFADCVKIKEGR